MDPIRRMLSLGADRLADLGRPDGRLVLADSLDIEERWRAGPRAASMDLIYHEHVRTGRIYAWAGDGHRELPELRGIQYVEWYTDPDILVRELDMSIRQARERGLLEDRRYTDTYVRASGPRASGWSGPSADWVCTGSPGRSCWRARGRPGA